MIQIKKIKAFYTFLITLFLSGVILAVIPTTISTFNSISIYWSPVGGEAGKIVTIQFRETGETVWRTGLPMKYNPIAGTTLELADYRGSIVQLPSNTQYEIQLTLEGTTETETVTASTWSETFPIAQTITVGNETREYSISNKNGSASGYILYDGTGSTVDASGNYDYCIDIDNSSYIIIRGFNLINAARSGVRLGVGCSNIIIEDCDISNWGRKEANNDFGVNQDAGIYSDRSDLKRVIIQRNKIHNPRYDSNNLSEDNNGSAHPSGPQGIVFYDNEGNHVIRYNEIYSDYEHMFNDVIGGATNASYKGFPGPDSDINNNYFTHCWDDGIEVEGGGRNVRIWSNYIDSTFVAIGNAPVSIGPLYVWKNTAGRSYTPLPNNINVDHAAFMKMGYSNSESWMTGHMYIYNNTVLQTNGDGYSGLGVSVTDNRYIKHCETRNNIFQTRGTENSISTRTQNVDNDYDYDFFNNSVPSGSENNGISGTPTYESGSGFNYSTMEAQYNLQNGTSGLDAGAIIPNFADNYEGTAPDMGAFESGRSALEYGVNATAVTYSSSTSGGVSTGTNSTLPSGLGTLGDPYKIDSLANLSWMLQNSSSWDKYFEQRVSINASETAYWDDSDDNSDGDLYNDPNDLTTDGNNEGWSGIGNSSQKFTGTYDGKGFEVHSVTINRPSAIEIGFFGYSNGGTIKNLGVTNININVDSKAGGLVGYSETSAFMVDNCYTTGSIAVDNGYVAGGLVGLLGDGVTGGTIQNSYSEVNVTTNAIQYAGGLVGLSKAGTITKCYSTGNVSGTGNHAGSFVGELQSNATVSECYCTGNITVNDGAQDVGAFIGDINAGTVSNCYANGDLSSSGSASGAGGFIGLNKGTVEYCYSVGSNSAQTDAGFIDNNSGTVTANFLDTEASCNTDGASSATEEITANMKITSTFTNAGWDFTNTWEIVGGDGANYPRLQDNPDPALPVELTSFEAVAKNGSVLLTWETATEVNNYGFDVEASTSSATGFEKIGFVSGHGNSNSPNSYSFVASPYQSYRLKQIDTDGGFEYSEVISASGVLAKTEMYQNHPNPFNPTTQISFILAKANNVKISVFNILGEKVAELINSKMEAGNHKVNFNATDLTTGVYIYRINTPNYIKSMKMLLLK